MIILNTGTIKKWDVFTIKNKPITSLNLMEKAGNACTNKIIQDIKDKKVKTRLTTAFSMPSTTWTMCFTRRPHVIGQ